MKYSPPDKKVRLRLMKIKFKNKSPITIAIGATSIFYIILGLLSISNVDSRGLRVLTQGSLSLTMLLNGVNCFAYKKQKVNAFCFWLVSGFLLYVMITTIYLGLQKNF